MADTHISERRAVYTIPGMEQSARREDVVYRTTAAGPLTMDVYRPAEAAADARLPAVIFVAGYSDVGYEKLLGRKFKDMAMCVSWGQLVAASGMVAIAYTNREPVTDLDALIEHVRGNAPALGIDGNRLGVWACSGNVPLALRALMGSAMRCGALLYGFMLDLDGATGVADAAQSFRFTNPNAGASLDDLNDDVPLLIVRAGREQFAGLNDSIDRFFVNALARNRPITLVNHATGPHAFDLFDDRDTSRAVVKQILNFLRASLM